MFQALSECIKSCENIDQVSKLARNLGRRHAEFADRGLGLEHFNSMRTAMKTVMAKRILKDTRMPLSERSTAIQVHTYVGRKQLQNTKVFAVKKTFA